jgi:ABC-type bacteriocin/lantibiotic exporter with double-glycine peptidase domain
MNLAPVATFAVYIIISVYWKHESLLTAQAFTSLALISLLATPTVIFIQALPKVIQCINCFDRIQEYCNYDFKPEVSRDANKEQTGSEMDLEPLATKARENQSPIQNGHISFNGHSFAWDRNRPSFLKDLHIEIKQGSINAVVGPVGSGKSSFLECILGEMISTSLEHRGISTSVAYCSQQAWLEHTSIRQNIIGTSPYDGKWYGEVVFSCGLEPDLRQLTKGDQTRVGSKGLNLSGGQRQRIVSEI